MTMQLDHFAWACSSLDLGVDEFERLGGPRATLGGSHSGQGTRNALVSLGEGIYLAIDAPDPEQETAGTYGAVLERLQGFDLNVVAFATHDIEAARATLEAAGLKAEVLQKSRLRPDGVLLRNAVLDIADSPFGRATPHIIQWHTDHHPSRSSPEGCRVVDFWVEHPDSRPLAALYAALGITTPVRPGATDKLIVTLEGANGRFVLPTT